MDWTSIFPQLITAVSTIAGTLAGAGLARKSSRTNTRTEWLMNSVRAQREYYAEVLHAANGVQEALHIAYMTRPKPVMQDMGVRDETDSMLWMQKNVRSQTATDNWLRIYSQRSVHAGRHVELTMSSIENTRSDFEYFFEKKMHDESSGAASLLGDRVDLLEREIRLESEAKELDLHRELSTGRKSRKSVATKEQGLDLATRSLTREREDIAKHG